MIELPLYCFFGYHKAATTFIDQNLLKAICKELDLRKKTIHSPKLVDFKVNEFIASNGLMFFSYINANYEVVKQLDRPYRGFHIIRDPRDVVVSAYYSHLNSHSTVGWPELALQRKKLKKLDKKQGLLATIEFLKDFTTAGYKIKVFDIEQSWNYHDPNILNIKFENFRGNEYKTMKQVCKFMGFMPSWVDMIRNKLNPNARPYIRGYSQTRLTSQRLKEIIQQENFNKVSKGRAKGEEDQKSHYRKGVSGEWKEYFDTEITLVFKKAFPNLVSDLGYEKDENW